ncbi:MAG: Asp-tRNA(Asn)/Glu-tRNA(Gln) amidotransferase subunit GatC [Candidatus Subteraquimicrobiales bacterium]|nr:Asp-tRNA(Asn)/Glu-tRNA(Gln) amidotransferase subunit GatC [Candidatus Subteraquimicrobiales bacterium]
MAISKKDVEHAALLARLALTEEEKEKFTIELSQILEHAEKISELDTKDIKPTSHALPLKNVFREDKRSPSLSQEKALSNAPAEESGMFKIPKIV